MAREMTRRDSEAAPLFLSNRHGRLLSSCIQQLLSLLGARRSGVGGHGQGSSRGCLLHLQGILASSIPNGEAQTIGCFGVQGDGV